MARARTVIDLLAEQPEEVLVRMRHATQEELSRAQAEVGRLTVEADQIEQALARHRRSGNAAARGVVTGERVLDVATRIAPPFTPMEVRAALEADGLTASVNAVRNHLNRLVEREQLRRNDDGYWIEQQPEVTLADPYPPEPELEAASNSDDIPF